MQYREIPSLTDNEKKRLWDGIKVDGMDICWEWQWSLSSGYGQMELRRNLERQNWHTHILVYREVYGTHIPGKDVMHSCDNRKCNNPFHLTQGTRSENMLDAASKERIGKFSKEKVQELLGLIDKGYAVGAAAKVLKISKTHAHRLVARHAS
jgi:hypothetical protein